MAEDKKEDVVMDGMPGADPQTKEDVEHFQVDLNFEEPETPEEPEEEEEVEETDEQDSEDQSEDEVPAETEEETSDGEGEPEEGEPEDVEQVVDELLDKVEEPEKPKEPEKAPMVPKSRLDEVLAKNKKMQKRIEEIEQAEAQTQAEAPQYNFDAKEIEYQEAILDGDAAKASSIRQEIRTAEREQTMFEVQQQMGQSIQLSQAEQELAAKAQEIGDTFDILNENSENFDTTLAEEVRDLRDAFMTQGFTPADSLAKATEYTLAAKRPELLNGAEDSVQAETNKQNKAAVEKRQKTTVKKKIEASKSQPPKLKGEGTAKRGDKVADINVLSDDEFGALPEETLRRMRGDFG